MKTICKFVSKSGLKQQGERAGTAVNMKKLLTSSHKALTLKASGSYGKSINRVSK